jgi:hypothetical protein
MFNLDYFHESCTTHLTPLVNVQSLAYIKHFIYVLQIWYEKDWINPTNIKELCKEGKFE